MAWVYKTLIVAALSTTVSTIFAQDATKAVLGRGIDLPYSQNSIIVRFKSGVSESKVSLVTTAAKARRVEKFAVVQGLELVQTVDVARSLDNLRKNPDVLYAEPDYVVKPTAIPNDPSFSQIWALGNSASSRIGAPQAWDLFTGDHNFIVAVIDTGVQYNHADLQANIFRNTGELAGNGIDDDHNGYIDDVNGWDFYTGDNDPSDEDGHGTHVAGTIGASGNNGFGVAGINWRCRILPLRFMGPNGGLTSDAIRALQYAVRMGARVSNNSWGGGGYSQSLYDAINSAKNAGHLFVAAAGNETINTDLTANYPSAFNLDNIISVAAVDNAGNLASFSNFGATSVDLAAPGVSIFSTIDNNGYGSMSGTSMATPHVAGAAALLWAANPNWSWSTVRSRLLSTVKPLAGLTGKTVTGGTLDLYRAMNVVPVAPAGVSNVNAVRYGTSTARVTWTDNSDNEIRFEVQREKYYYYTWRGTTTLQASANSTVLQDNAGVGYARYRVRAVNTVGASAWSNWVMVKL